MKRQKVDVEELRKVFRLKDGNLERLNSNYKDAKWTVVKNKSNNVKGYCQVSFNNSKVKYHTIVWILTTGEDIPEGMQIDHINGNKVDNRFENLRLVTNRENNQNKKAHRQGKLVGCCFDNHANKYMSRIRIGKKIIYLGHYKTEQEAHKVYLIACQHIEEYVDNDSFRDLIKMK